MVLEFEMTFSERSLSVHMSVRPSVCPFVRLSICPSCPIPSSPKKITETENIAKQSCYISSKGKRNAFKVKLPQPAVLGKAKLSSILHTPSRHTSQLHVLNFKITCFHFSSPPQSRFQAVLCASTPRK